MILLEKRVKKGMIEEALKAFPDKCCGFVFGLESDNGDRVFSDFLPVEDVIENNDTATFEIKPEEYIKAEVHAHETELNLLGIYFSHPNGNSQPDEADKALALPNFSYILLSMPEHQKIEIRSWQLNDAKEFEEELIYKTENVQQ